VDEILLYKSRLPFLCRLAFEYGVARWLHVPTALRDAAEHCVFAEFSFWDLHIVSESSESWMRCIWSMLLADTAIM
jgi:hypothetical protein